jgi:hypothetical protein
VDTRRFRLEGASLPELQARVRAEHGAAARIVSAEQVTVGGIRGFFARRHVEVTVEVPVPVPVPGLGADRAVPQRRRAAHARSEATTRLGIAALLDAADETEALLADQAFPGQPGPASGGQSNGASAGTTARPAPMDVPSTAGPDFARLMDELTFATSSATVAPVPAPSATPNRAPSPVAGSAVTAPLPAEGALALTPGHPGLPVAAGDLVLLIGPAADVAEAARLMAAGAGAPALAGPDRPGDRREARAARARGVELGRSVLVAWGLPCGTDPATTTALARAAAALGADQVWAVVDAGRKSADTARWVRDVGETLALDAVAVLAADSTDTPDTVYGLGLPIGWLAPPVRPAGSVAGPPNPFAIG